MADDVFGRYLTALRKTPVEKKTEHTDRAALEELLNAFAAKAQGNLHVQHEPKRIAEKGAPDFKVTKAGLILGYVENKAIGEDLKKVVKSDQIARYRTLSQNLLLTDYMEFVWITKDGTQRAVLCSEDTLENRKVGLGDEAIAAVSKLLEGFFSSAPQKVSDSKDLAEELARRSRLLRDYLSEELVRQEREHQEGRLYGLFQTFRDQVFHDLTLAEFADAFAQMLAYGLFLARLNAGEKQKITLNNAREHVPGSFRLIRELIDFLTELDKEEYAEVRWVVEEVLSIVNGMNLTAIQESLSFRGRRAISRKVRAGDEEEHRLFERDPFIYFYEDYLKAYDKDMRKGRGVYYTPPPIVNFIVRAVDDILKGSFGINDGLADSKVTVLDFACGTGTFLLEVFERIFDNIGGADSGKADLIVRDHILQHLYGFEYLIAPYTIAHLKLSQYLKDKGHALPDKERLRVFLTNTLEPIAPQRNLYLPAVTQEVEEAQKVKDKPILVITGNPPYSARSKNTGPWITNAIEAYKLVDGKPFGERKHWLHDDYVKFIRFAQMKMDGGTSEYIDVEGNLQSLTLEGAERGIIAVITNHSWLENPTFRGMRQSLIASFQQIYIIDLHGNSKKQEVAPGGFKDENIFDIEQGVAIAIFVKHPGLSPGVWRGDFWGSRLEKYQQAAGQTLSSTSFKQLEPTTPFYMFSRYDSSGARAYDHFWSIANLFPINVAGIITARDNFSIDMDRGALEKRISTFIRSKKSRKELAAEFDLKDTRGWSPDKAHDALVKSPDWQKNIKTVLYRPFDERFIVHDPRVIDWGRWNLMSNLRDDEPSLVGVRQVAETEFNHVIASTAMADNRLTRSSKGTCYQFPLYIHRVASRSENLDPEFRSFLDTRFDHHYTPEEILGYIYAVLHAPAYRARYAEFLRIDFPRIPFPESADDFEALSKLGWALVEAHLLRNLPPGKLAVYHGKGDHVVEAVRWSDAEQAVWINKTQCFKPLPENVWNFHIGGYQVLDKYLKSRKGRTLTLDEINHVGRIAGSLAFTIAQMEKIDRAYAAAFADRG